MKKGMLKFSEYRISYAKEIIETQNNLREENLEYVIFKMYCGYLVVCGFKNIGETIYLREQDKIMRYIDGQYNNKYNDEFIKDINKKMDELVELEFKKIDK